MSQPEAVERTHLAGRPGWVLRTRAAAWVLQLGAEDVLLLPYWGARGGELSPRPAPPSTRAFLDGQPTAYPVYGDPLFKEVCLVATRPDGSRETRLHFVQDHVFEADGTPALDLVFADERSGLRLTHHFQVVSALDLVARSASITNTSPEPLVLEQALSAALPLPPGDYD